jgi:hypothetical protein
MAKKKRSVGTQILTEESAAAIQAAACDQVLRYEAELVSCLAAKGDNLARDLKYKHLNGLDAIRYFLMQKHNWTPSQVKSMSYDDLLFAYSQET